ncbi:MAG: T9SS type A sorting domain-containing protein [Bacteroidales bacterium]|nr:T9SS type A sorting domain-containing protein [Bacteroidales bacterium]
MKVLFTIRRLAVCGFCISILIAALLLLPGGRIKTGRAVYEEELNILAAAWLKDRSGSPGKAGVDDPDMASLREYLMTMDPKEQRVPAERLALARQQTAEMIESGRSSGRMLPEWEEWQADMGGRTRAMMWDPNDPAGLKVWAGGVTGGLWYIDDISSSVSEWTPVSDMWANMSISSLAWDPNDPMTYYAGTGEAQTALIIYRESSGRGCGILASYDAGLTWEVIPSSVSFAYVTDIVVRDENGTSVIYAGVASGEYMGMPHQSVPSDGLYRSADSGITWEQVLPDIPGQNVPFAPSDIELTSGDRLIVGTMPNIDKEGGAYILYSDAGTHGSWTVYDDYHNIIINQPVYNLPGRVILSSSPSDPGRVYALIASGYMQYLVAYECRHIARSDDHGETWSSLITPPNSPSTGNWAYIAWHALAVGVSPTDPDHLFIGGLDVWKGETGGSAWSKVSDWLKMYSGGGDDYVHGDIHTFLFRPGHPDEMIIGTDGGVFYTQDAGASSPVFMERNRNYNTLQTYACAISPYTGDMKGGAGFQDNGSLYYEGDPVTIDAMVSGGDGAYCFWDRNEPELCITSSQYNRYYIWLNETLVTTISNFPSGNFICAAGYDYRINTLYANAAWFMLFRQDTLLRISNLPSGIPRGYIGLGTGSTVPFNHITVSPHSPEGQSTLFVGSQSGRLFRVDNAQDVPVTTGIGSTSFPAANISCVAVGGSEDTLLVTFSNYGVSSVWQTCDGGQSWEEKEGNLPDMPVRWALYHPDDASHAMLATDLGVWKTDNLQDEDVEWYPGGGGLAHVRVDMLRLRESDRTVLAGTHGRGLFSCTWNLPPVTSLAEKSGLLARVYPNPASGKLFVQLSEVTGNQITVHLLDVSGKTVLETAASRDGKDQLLIPVTLDHIPPGIYLLNIYDGQSVHSEKIVVTP